MYDPGWLTVFPRCAILSWTKVSSTTFPPDSSGAPSPEDANGNGARRHSPWFLCVMVVVGSSAAPVPGDIRGASARTRSPCFLDAKVLVAAFALPLGFRRAINGVSSDILASALLRFCSLGQAMWVHGVGTYVCARCRLSPKPMDNKPARQWCMRTNQRW